MITGHNKFVREGPLFVGSDTEMYAVNMDGHDLGILLRKWQGRKDTDLPMIIPNVRITIEVLQSEPVSSR